MADDEGSKKARPGGEPRPSYPPKKKEKPQGDPRPTRRQMLASFLGGGTLLGCGPGEGLPGGPGTTGGTNGAGGSAGSGGAGGTAAGGLGAGGSNSGGSPAGGSSSGGSPAGGTGAGGQSSGGQSSGGAEAGGSGGEASGGEDGTGGNESGKSRRANDIVPLGSTGIMVSRLAMGSGSTGFNGSSKQTEMGSAFVDLLVQSYGQGITFWETADAYGSHGAVGEAAAQVGRENVVLMTKTKAVTKAECEADLARFMDELGTDYIDIVLLHIRTSPNWAEEGAGAMEALSEAKAAGLIGAHGVSCHSLAALQLAASLDWVDVHLARINPFQLHMDADPATIISLLAAEKAKGKGVIGMKILAQGDAIDSIDQCIEHATKLDALDCFTIGFAGRAEFDEVVRKISEVKMG